jgi:AraC-like DNA-binding protein
MAAPSPPNRFPVSLFATPNALHREIFYTVPRAGHLITGPGHHIQREHFPGYELILCLRGRGWVRISGRRHEVRAGQFVWIDCHRPHEYGAVSSCPWEVYWIRVEGPKMERMCEILSVRDAPVFSGFDLEAGAAAYGELFELIQANAPDAAARIHAAVARLISLAFVARQRQTLPVTATTPPPLRRAVEKMSLFYFEKHTVANLALLSGMSVTHFARLFKNAFGTSPIDWLRRERISQAKRKLADTRLGIEEIARQVGYNDRFYFSKDFKHLTGLSPREFRLREREPDGTPSQAPRQAPPATQRPARPRPAPR